MSVNLRPENIASMRNLVAMARAENPDAGELNAAVQQVRRSMEGASFRLVRQDLEVARRRFVDTSSVITDHPDREPAEYRPDLFADFVEELVADPTYERRMESFELARQPRFSPFGLSAKEIEKKSHDLETLAIAESFVNCAV